MYARSNGTQQRNLWGPPMRIRKVFIKGNERTKAEVFENELQDAYEASTIGEIGMELQHAVEELKSLDIFESIEVELDEAKNGKKNETDVTITVKEKKWKNLHIGATTDGNEETAETKILLTNALGLAEKISFSGSRSLIGSTSFRASVQKPRFLGFPLYLNATAHDELHNYERFSSFSEALTGGSVSVSDYNGMHELCLQMGWRDIIPRRNKHITTAFDASASIISEALPSTKTSLKYIFKDDSRNDPILPTSGSLFHYSTEVAGLFGDVQFVKAEVSAQRHYGFGPNVFGNPILNLSFGSQFGAVKSYGKEAKRPARINDRFFAGGPLSLRGFNHKGIGPRASPDDGGVASGDSLGGEISYIGSTSIGLPCPIPFLAIFGARTHFFANCGALTTWDRVLDENKWIKNLVEDTRVSLGLGIVLGTQIGRIEANYSWILKSHDHDNIKRAQIGLGMTFT